MLRASLPKRSTNVLKDSPSSWRMLMSTREVRSCGFDVANYAPNWYDKVSKQSMENGARRVNQLKAAPLRDVGNTLQKMASSKV